MRIPFNKYQGTGNDFVIIDNRNNTFPKEKTIINNICDRRFGIGADGLILLENSDNQDFKMIYYNADGIEGSMCGNGGRCIVAFAKKLELIEEETVFEAADGLHTARIEDGIISLKMKDVSKISERGSSIYLDTGSPHHIDFCATVDSLDVKKQGAEIRYSDPYKDGGGTNVNFVAQSSDNVFKVRTYERGVENETLACGTGVTAVAIAAHNTKRTTDSTVLLEVMGGQLEVSFDYSNGTYLNIYLKGPAQFVFEGIISI